MSDRRAKALELTPSDASRSEEEPESNGQRVPRLALLDGFSKGLDDSRGVNITRLEALTELRVKTASAVYQITVLEPFKSKILIRGGSLFAEGANVTLSGASLGRSFLKMSCIWIGLQMELHSGDCTIVTSPVSSIEILEDTYPTGSFAA